MIVALLLGHVGALVTVLNTKQKANSRKQQQKAVETSRKQQKKEKAADKTIEEVYRTLRAM